MKKEISFQDDKEAADNFKAACDLLKREIAKVIMGQEEAVERVLLSIFCKGHALLIGVPGLAKTLLVQTISSVLALSFSRIQFTPDLMPSDILGAETIDKEKNLQFVLGPIFSNIILADEINRTPPKTQAALLEAMQEGSVTISGKRHPIAPPFFVLATQNPIEQEGTYPLPEAQLDRFMCFVQLDYPTFEEEVNVVKNTTSEQTPSTQKIMGRDDICYYRALIRRVPITDNVINYAVTLARKTRPNVDNAPQVTREYLQWGAGPRASQYLTLGAKCHALMQGKYTPDIEDVQAIAPAILAHRLVKNFKASAENITERAIIDKLI